MAEEAEIVCDEETLRLVQAAYDACYALRMGGKHMTYMLSGEAQTAMDVFAAALMGTGATGVGLHDYNCTRDHRVERTPPRDPFIVERR